MKHIVIRNLGPLKEADVELKRINVIIGSQSSGKSCVLKTACYCTWVEKRIELTQTADFFAKEGNFLKELERFHKLKGYIKPDTFISYESDFMAFSFDNATKKFEFEWKNGRWNYKRSKVTYIPAERNLVAAIPNWLEVNFEDNNIRSFMADWETARQETSYNLPILNLGVSYRYDSNTKSDQVLVADGTMLRFTNTSSGLQSVIPLYVHLNYIFKRQAHSEMSTSIKGNKEKSELLHIIYDTFIPKIGTEATPENKEKYPDESIVLHHINKKFYFLRSDAEKQLLDICERFLYTSAYDIFLEEPEENLFPPTQSNLVEWLISTTKGEQPSNLFIATHSPYILNAFMEKQDIDMTLLYTRTEDGLITVKTATEQDFQDIYDYGVDAFFNIETLG
jgi:predicted ATPase